MQYIKCTWRTMFAEPFMWLFYCFFQPARFKRECEITGFAKRMRAMLRLALPVFLCSYPLALLVHLLGESLPGVILNPISISAVNGHHLVVTGPSLLHFLLAVALATFLSVVWSILWGMVGGVAGGIAWGVALSIAGGIGSGDISVGGSSQNILAFFELGISAVIVLGIAGGIVGSIAGGIARSTVEDIVETFMGSIVAGGGTESLRVFLVYGDIAASIITLIAGVLFSGIIWLFSATTGIALAMALGIILGVVRPSLLSIALAIVVAVESNFISLPKEAIGGFLSFDLVLIASSIVGYFRLPLYPVSSLSALRAYLASRQNPPGVFSHLHRSALYWDERVFLPLPGLKHTLLLAAEQNVEQVREEIAFIVAERPQQIGAAQAASLEIAIHNLEMREELHEIAQAAQRLTELLPQEAGLIDPRWVAPFAHLSDAIRDAARACSPLGWQARRTALQEMIENLKKIHPNMAFRDAQLNRRLGEVVKTWRAAAQHTLEEMEQAPEKTSLIDNPYNPGPALELRDSLFVGRRDLAQQLGEALGRRNRRPTFLLQGERRMGKSSTLKQLPDLLGARYLPIFYDLQTHGFSSSIAVFLGKISDEIAKEMNARGLAVKRLPYEHLQEASRRNEAEVYYLFERWFEEIERILEQKDRTLLLTFDEFEKLEGAGRRGHLDLDLLLDWFRSVIQNHPRLTLLFSGVRSFGAMGMSWAGYFVNVQTLKVSFLQPAEAYQLIARPVPDFPSEQLFGKGAVEEIMHVTNCHPFLVQAVCSALLDDLNVDTDKRSSIELVDVCVAVKQVIKSWDSYFRDLWTRTSEDQRACILTLKHLGESDLLTLEQQSGLDERAMLRALEMLIERDIVLYEGHYRLAVPLFKAWIEGSSYR